MKVLVVGGAGYIGKHVCRELINKGHEPVILDKKFRKIEGFGHYVYGDYGTFDFASSFIESFDVIIVLAGYIEVGESVDNPLKYWDNNTAKFIRFLKAVNAAAADPIPVVFSSSAAVYGTNADERACRSLREDDPVDPQSPYGVTKLVNEVILETSKIPYVSLRYFNACGADMQGDIGEDHEPESHLIPLALAAAAGHRTFKLYGDDYDTPDGTCIRDYIHVSDLASAHVSACEYIVDGHASAIFNLGTGQGYSVKNIIDSIFRIVGEFEYETVERRAGDPAILVANANLASAPDGLNWFPVHSDLDNIIRSAWKYYTSHN